MVSYFKQIQNVKTDYSPKYLNGKDLQNIYNGMSP